MEQRPEPELDIDPVPGRFLLNDESPARLVDIPKLLIKSRLIVAFGGIVLSALGLGARECFRSATAQRPSIAQAQQVFYVSVDGKSSEQIATRFAIDAIDRIDTWLAGKQADPNEWTRVCRRRLGALSPDGPIAFQYGVFDVTRTSVPRALLQFPRDNGHSVLGTLDLLLPWAIRFTSADRIELGKELSLHELTPSSGLSVSYLATSNEFMIATSRDDIAQVLHEREKEILRTVPYDALSAYVETDAASRPVWGVLRIPNKALIRLFTGPIKESWRAEQPIGESALAASSLILASVDRESDRSLSVSVGFKTEGISSQRMFAAFERFVSLLAEQAGARFRNRSETRYRNGIVVVEGELELPAS